MKFLHLSADSFRNLTDITFEPHPRCNVFFGQNGQGKTNLLESLYLLSTLKSFRTHRIEELIQFEQTRSKVLGEIEHQGVSHILEVELIKDRPAQKITKVNEKISKTFDYLERAHAILFTPEDLRLAKGAPSGRRKFLDRAIFNLYPSYLKEAQLYERVLKQRNAVLRGRDPELLPVYDEQLAQMGATIYKRRISYLGELSKKLREAFEKITQLGEPARLVYESSYASDSSKENTSKKNISEALWDRLLQDRTRDLDKGYTHSGPHSDDIGCFFGSRLVATYASQGQTRAFVLALKIAEIQYFCESRGFAPILLLDDVSSELDEIRTQQLFSFLQEIESQIFITTTNQEHVPFGRDRKNISIQEGKICL